MRNKIFSELVKKFPGLDKKFLGLIADKLAKKVTEESGIEQAITDYDNAASITDLATEFQKEGDRRVNDAKKEWEKKNPPKQSDKTDDDEDEDPDDEDDDDAAKKGKEKTSKKKSSDRTPKYIKDLTDGIKALTEKVGNLEKEKTQGTIKDKIKNHQKVKDVIPEKFWSKRVIPEKEEDLETFIDDVANDWEEIHPVEEGAKRPALSGSGGGKEESGGKKASKEELDAVMKEIM